MRTNMHRLAASMPRRHPFIVVRPRRVQPPPPAMLTILSSSDDSDSDDWIDDVAQPGDHTGKDGAPLGSQPPCQPGF